MTTRIIYANLILCCWGLNGVKWVGGSGTDISCWVTAWNPISVLSSWVMTMLIDVATATGNFVISVLSVLWCATELHEMNHKKTFLCFVVVMLYVFQTMCLLSVMFNICHSHCQIVSAHKNEISASVKLCIFKVVQKPIGKSLRLLHT